MGTHMKTTIDIADSLLAEAKQVAAARHTTVRALVEVGLRQVLHEQRARQAPFELRRASVKGRGLRGELQGAAWERLRELAYEGRGG